MIDHLKELHGWLVGLIPFVLDTGNESKRQLDTKHLVEQIVIGVLVAILTTYVTVQVLSVRLDDMQKDFERQITQLQSTMAHQRDKLDAFIQAELYHNRRR